MEGLQALAATATIHVPRVLRLDGGVLQTEWLDLRPPDAAFGARFGTALAALHAAPPPVDTFGWPRDNFIGATPQRNAPTPGWIDFFREHRLRAMQERLRDPALADAVEDVIGHLPRFFDDGHVPRPALIHGDLWQGNWGMLADGTPVIFDPAVSVSDPECELAMMELFGSMPSGFLAAYRAHGALHAGYGRRCPLYQLYHLLNHTVLFGGGYAAQALRVARGLTRSA